MEVFLSSRQRTILRLIADGLTSEEIGAQLSINKRTIEGMKKKLFEITGTKSSAHLVAYGFRNDLIR